MVRWVEETVPIANIRVFEDAPTVATLERRFPRCLRNLREQRENTPQTEPRTGRRSEETFELFGDSLPIKDKLKIANRAMSYVERQDAATGMQHLKSDDRTVMRRLKDGATISRVPTEHDANVLAGTLHEEMPWMGPAT